MLRSHTSVTTQVLETPPSVARTVTHVTERKTAPRHRLIVNPPIKPAVLVQAPTPAKTPTGNYYLLPVNLNNTQREEMNEKMTAFYIKKNGKSFCYTLEKIIPDGKDTAAPQRYTLNSTTQSAQHIAVPDNKYVYAVIFNNESKQLEMHVGVTRHYLIAALKETAPDNVEIIETAHGKFKVGHVVLAGDIYFKKGCIQKFDDHAGGFGIHNIKGLSDEQKYEYQQSMRRAAIDAGLPIELIHFTRHYPKPAPVSTAAASDALFARRPIAAATAPAAAKFAAVVPGDVPAPTVALETPKQGCACFIQ